MDILIDDASPQFSWITTTPGGVGWIVDHTMGTTYPDPLTNRYSDATFHATFTEGDRMEFRFNGTGVTVYGAKRGNHGTYGVIVDELEEDFMDGYSAKDDMQAVLYEKFGLSTDREHVIKVTNYPSRSKGRTGRLWMDIDHVIITHQIPSTMYTTYIDDNAPSIEYGSGWQSYGSGTGGYYNMTSHMSTTLDSAMEFKFNGTSIQMYAGIHTNHGNYTIALDGGDEQQCNAYNWELLYQVPIFTASGLEDREHTIRYRNAAPAPNNFLSFDFAIVNSSVKPDGWHEAQAGGSATSITSSTVGPSGTSSTAPSGTATSSSAAGGSAGSEGKSGPSIAALSGGIAGGVVALALLGVLLFWFLRQRKRPSEDRVDQYYTRGYRPSEPPSSQGQGPVGQIDLVDDPRQAATAAWVQNAPTGSLLDRKQGLHSPGISATLNSPMYTPHGYEHEQVHPGYFGAVPPSTVPPSSASSRREAPYTAPSSASGPSEQYHSPVGSADPGPSTHSRNASLPFSAATTRSGSNPFGSPISDGTGVTTATSDATGSRSPNTGTAPGYGMSSVHSRGPSSGSSDLTSFQVVQAQQRTQPYAPSRGPTSTSSSRDGEGGGGGGGPTLARIESRGEREIPPGADPKNFAWG
ncbi:hypothetical protein IAU59_007379 [Kwoniella sp. CBS 9459]